MVVFNSYLSFFMLSASWHNVNGSVLFQLLVTVLLQAFRYYFSFFMLSASWYNVNGSVLFQLLLTALLQAFRYYFFQKHSWNLHGFIKLLNKI